MRLKDRVIFRNAAKDLNLWILVRDTNQKSLKYIGKAGYKPKRIDCKAKTADFNIGPYELAGLVVSPFIHPRAFRAFKLPDAKLQWGKTGYLIGGRYRLNTYVTSTHYGCLMIDGNYIHGDYDLFDIVDPTQPHRNLGLVASQHGVRNILGANTTKVMDYVNPRIGTQMIQHGGHAQFSDLSNQSKIDVFGPNGEDFSLTDENSLTEMYAKTFKGRITLTGKF